MERPADESVEAVVRRLLPERLHRLQRSGGLPVVFGGAIHASAAGPRLVISRLAGTVGTSLRGLAVDAGRGLGGAVLRDAEPGRVDDYASTAEITHEYDRIVVDEEGLTSVIAVPVIVQGSVQAVIYGAVRDDSPIGDRAVRSAAVVAAQLQRDVEAALARGPAQRPAPARSAAALAELAEVIGQTADPLVRARLEQIHRDLGGTPAGRPPGTTQLAPREREVLGLAGEGASNLEIAAELGLSPETVKAYLRTAMRKVDAPNRTVAAQTARRWGLL